MIAERDQKKKEIMIYVSIYLFILIGGPHANAIL